MIDSTVVLAQIDSALEDHRSLRLATAVESLIECAAPAYDCRDPECTCPTDRYRWIYESAFPRAYLDRSNGVRRRYGPPVVTAGTNGRYEVSFSYRTGDGVR